MVVGCSERHAADLNLSSPDSKLAGVKEQDNSLKLTAQEYKAIYDNIPDKGKWVQHNDLADLLEYMQRYRIDALFGSKMVNRIIDAQAKVVQPPRQLAKIDPDSRGRYRDLFIEILQKEGISEAKRIEHIQLYDQLVERDSGLQKKLKKDNSLALAYAPELNGTLQQVNGSPLDPFGPNPTYVTFYHEVDRPTSYAQRSISNRARWYMPVNDIFVYGYTFQLLINVGCRDSLGNARFQPQPWSNFSPTLYGFQDGWDPGLHPATTIRSTEWSSSAFCSLLHRWYNPATEQYEFGVYDATSIDADNIQYVMGGRGDINCDNMYNTADVDLWSDIWAYRRTPNEYESFAADANASGDINVADAMTIVYLALGLAPCN